LWKTETVSVLAGVDYTHVGGHGPDYVALSPASRNNASPWTEATDPIVAPYFFAAAAAQGACLPGGFFPTVVNPGKCPTVAPYPSPPFPPGTLGPYTSAFSFPGVGTQIDNAFWKVHADISADLGFAKLTVLPAYQSAAMGYNSTPAGLAYKDSPDDSKAESLEARLSNASGPVSWVAGLYYFHQTQDSSEFIDGGLVQNNNAVTNQSTRSEAGFGELTFSVTDETRLVAGARYTSDRRTIDGSVFAVPPSVAFLPTSPANIACFAGLPNPCLLENYAGERTFSKFTWKAGIEQDLTPQNLLFATVSTGFKAGGFDQSAGFTPGSHEALSYNPENLTAFELGSRNRFLDNRLQFNAEAFYWKYKDHQEPRLTEDGLGVLSFDYENAGNATLYGLDLDLVAKPTDADTVRATVEYLHSVYDIHGRPLHAKRFFWVLVHKKRSQPYIRPLSATLRVAGPDGICWLTPDHFCGLSKSRAVIRLSQPWSYLWCHHFKNACAIGGEKVVSRVVCRCPVLGGYAAAAAFAERYPAW
jgi:iron complex outermembrane receptor protein